jgi:hypothetical protein
MDLNRANSTAVAQRYFGTSEKLLWLGGGITGNVYLSPEARSAVKVHQNPESFNTELKVYRRLKQLDINVIHGLSVPKLKNYEIDNKLIEMDFVKAPYLLDFAGVIFIPPEEYFQNEDTLTDWHKTIRFRYGSNASIAYAIHNALARHGIYYMDFRPSNLNLTGLADLEPPDQSEDDGF